MSELLDLLNGGGLPPPRPSRVRCAECGRWIPVGKRGPVRRWCRSCRQARYEAASRHQRRSERSEPRGDAITHDDV